MILNHIAICIDRSGSMVNLTSKVVDELNNLISVIKQDTHKFNQQTYLSVYSFNSSVQLLCDQLDINYVRQFNPADFKAFGSTALFDCFTAAICDLSKVDNKASRLLYFLTDGFENSSSLYNVQNASRLIREKQATDKWSFVFNIPPGHKREVVYKYSLPEANVKEWDQTEEGVQSVAQAVADGFTNYYSARALGKTSTQSFFADMNDISNKDLRRLDDLSSQFRILTVDKECEIKDFIERKMKKPYVKGSAFYQLSKKEKLQQYKQILVMKRGEKKIYGGQSARDLLGLPNADVKIDIKNLAEYELYLESQSTNRLLCRGTKVLVRK